MFQLTLDPLRCALAVSLLRQVAVDMQLSYFCQMLELWRISLTKSSSSRTGSHARTCPVTFKIKLLKSDCIQLDYNNKPTQWAQPGQESTGLSFPQPDMNEERIIDGLRSTWSPRSHGPTWGSWSEMCPASQQFTLHSLPLMTEADHHSQLSDTRAGRKRESDTVIGELFNIWGERI